MFNKIYIKNIIKLVLRIAAILVIYQFCRLLFFVYNSDYFSEIHFIDYIRIVKGSIRFDISAVLYINALVIILTLFPSKKLIMRWYQNIIHQLYIYCNLLGIIINIIDVFYYPFSKRRMTYSLVNEFSNEKGIFNMLVEFSKDYWFVIPLFIIIFYILKYLSNLTKINNKEIRYTKKTIFSSCVICLSCLTLVIFGMRGSFIIKNRPITISNAGVYTKNPNEISLIINSPFSLMRTWTIQELEKKNYFTESQLSKYTPILKHYDNDILKKKNVIIIILESMATEYYGFYNQELEGYQGYTPFLDSLINYSYTSYNCFANGTKSIDAIPSIFASIPTSRLHFSLSKYCTNKIDGIGKILKKEGYNTSFFHGAPNGSMGFESMTKLLGIERYYGMDNYNNNSDFDGVWGIWDDKFFEYFADKLNKMKEPFLSSFFSCSSHHPFNIPEEFNHKFRQGKHPMHECVQYTDYSLKLFFEKVKNEKWFQNTLFVITADHTNKSFERKYQSSIGIFEVPIIFYDPSNLNLNQKTHKIIQHIDIMPSILSYLNYNKPFLSLGNSIFDKSSGFSINYNNGYMLYMDNKVITYSELEDKTNKIFNRKNDLNLKNNILNSTKKEDVLKYENIIKAFIQTYNNRMINNTMSLEN